MLKAQGLDLYKRGQLTNLASTQIHLLFCLVTSLSIHAMNYIFSLPDEVKILALSELHKEDEIVTENTFRQHGYTASVSPAEKSEVRNHGGECVAVRSYINSKPVPTEVQDRVKECFMTALRFSARVVRFRGAEIIFFAAYFWVYEGFSQRNITILRQIDMVIKMSGLPWIAFGDFNITFEDFQESEWLQYLDADLLHPNMKSTTSLSQNRVIDFGLMSRSLKGMFRKSRPIYTVPWGPHFAALYEFVMDPMALRGKVVCIPRSLPMKISETSGKRWQRINS